MDNTTKVLHESQVTTQDETYSGSPGAARLSAEATRRHGAACAAQESGYIDPDSGKFVLTSWFLLSQGRCCGKGCRHCPWPETAQRASKRDNVPSWPDKEMEQLALGAYEKEDKR